MSEEQEIAGLSQLSAQRMLELLLRANKEGRLKVTKEDWHRKTFKVPYGQGLNGRDHTYSEERYYEIACTVYPRSDNTGGDAL